MSLARFLLRIPFSLALLAAVLAIGAVSQALFRPAPGFDWYEYIAYGLPSLEAGRWWTPLSGLFFLEHPVQYAINLLIIVALVAWAEYLFGTLRAAGLFVAGHLVGVLGTSALLLLARPLPWEWTTRLGEAIDVGASCGAFACLTFAIATLRSPWRLRARIALVAGTSIALLYLGTLPDVEHFLTVVVALTVSGLLPAFRRPAGRPSEREWRLIALAGLIVVGVVQVFDAVVPTDGPLGSHEVVPGGWADLALDLVVILLIANGIRRGFRVAWWAAVVLGLFNMLTLLLALALLPLLQSEGLLGEPGAVYGQVIAPAILWIAELTVLFAGRGAFRVPLRRSRRLPKAAEGGTAGDGTEPTRTEPTRAALARHGGSTLSWMSTWDGNRYFAARDGVLAYQSHSGVAIGLGDPICAPGDTAALIDDFVRFSQRSGLTPCLFSVTRAAVDAAPETWRSTVIAEDTIIDLPSLELTGKKWQSVRASLNRAGREQIRFRLTTLDSEPWAVLAQVRAISEQWAGDKGLPEMRFTLGTVDEALDPQVRVGLAIDEDGSLHGVTSWLPVHGTDGRIRGWTLDLMRRRDGGFAPVMEFLIASSALAFKEEGYEIVSLSGAPLVRAQGEGLAASEGPVERVLDALGGALEPLYGFRSLHAFKTKFNPRYEPMHLLYRDEADLPRIGLAMTRAYLPDASLRELVSLTASGR